MGLIKITADMTESERTAVINTNMQYLQLSNRLRKYPIGMIVQFATDIDPNKLFGGTWERIKGAFIWGIDDGETAGITGGEKTHTLTEAELPVIDGRIATAVVGAHGTKGVTGHAYGTDFGLVTETIGGAKGAAGTQYGYGYKFGSGQAHNNMPPNYGAYVWRKTGHGIGEDPTLTEYEAFVQQMNTAISEALSKERLITNAACANALRGSASGAAVSLTDVSPNEHMLGVKVRRRNLFDKSTLTAGTNVVELTQTTNGFTFKTSATSTTMMVSSNIYLTAGTYYGSGTVTCSNTSYKGGWGVYDKENNKFIINAASRGTINDKFTVTESKTYQLNFYAPYNSPVGTMLTFENVQLEKGSTATPYAPYISDLTNVIVTRYGTVETDSPQTYNPSANGTVSGVKSLYPTTTLMTDTEGAIIEAEYSRDINKAFAELQQAVLSMGGNT